MVKDKRSGTERFGYNYVSGSQVLEAIRPKMNDLGLLLKPEIIEITNERQDYNTKTGSKSEILTKVIQCYTWIDTDSGEREVCQWGANGQNDWEKGLGSALTYGERYFLLKFFHIPTDEDDVDNSSRKANNPSNQPAQKQQQSKPKGKKWLNVYTKDGKETEIFNKIVERVNNGENINIDYLKGYFNIDSDNIAHLIQKGFK